MARYQRRSPGTRRTSARKWSWAREAILFVTQCNAIRFVYTRYISVQGHPNTLICRVFGYVMYAGVKDEM